MMGEYDFYVDSEALINLKSEISSKIGSVQSSLSSMESAVTAMGSQDGWVSDVYNILSEKFTERKEALEYAVSYLKAYEATIAAAAEKAPERLPLVSTGGAEHRLHRRRDHLRHGQLPAIRSGHRLLRKRHGHGIQHRPCRLHRHGCARILRDDPDALLQISG